MPFQSPCRALHSASCSRFQWRADSKDVEKAFITTNLQQIHDDSGNHCSVLEAYLWESVGDVPQKSLCIKNTVVRYLLFTGHWYGLADLPQRTDEPQEQQCRREVWWNTRSRHGKSSVFHSGVAQWVFFRQVHYTYRAWPVPSWCKDTDSLVWLTELRHPAVFYNPPWWGIFLKLLQCLHPFYIWMKLELTESDEVTGHCLLLTRPYWKHDFYVLF